MKKLVFEKELSTQADFEELINQFKTSFVWAMLDQRQFFLQIRMKSRGEVDEEEKLPKEGKVVVV